MSIMIIMKKPYIKYLLLALIFITVVISVIILNINNSRKTNFINYPVNFSLCNNNLFEVEIYCDRKNLSFFNTEEVTSVSLIDEEENYYQVKIKSISISKKVMIDNHNYHLYTLKLELPFKSNCMIHINNIKLKIINIRGEEINFKIGNISMVSGDYFSLVDTKSIVGMAKLVENYATLDQIKVELYNFQPKPVILKKAELISSVVSTNIEELKVLNDETLELTIPITYLKNTFIDGVGVLLTWEYQGSTYQQLLNPYVLFKTSTAHTLPIHQTYEVY